MVDRDVVVALLNRRRFPWTVLRLLVLWALLSIGLVAGGVAWHDARAAADCMGPWPNCPGKPIEVALLLAFFVYAPGLVALAGLLALAQLFGSRLQMFRSVVALVAAATAVVTTLVFIAEAVA